jgi:spore coat protein A, manganese oxidase
MMAGMTRRRFLQYGAVGGAAVLLPWRLDSRALAAIPGGTLDPSDITKYQLPLIVPPAMPRTSKINVQGGKSIDYYEIAVRQFQQRILPPGMPVTTVWSYGSVNHPGSFNYPAFTIEAKWQAPVRVKWINGLVAGNGSYLPHLLAVDPTLHWANPPGGTGGRDMRPTFASTPGRYTGPVPIVTHLHGSEGVGDESDGYAEAWFLPAARDIPAGYATVGTWYNTFKSQFLAERAAGHPSDTWQAGTATFQYPNDQRATTLWYHDHTLGMTRLNVYAGPAGFYLLRGGPDDQVIDTRFGTAALLPAGSFEIPIAVQDRSFNDDGSLFYPDSREFFDGYAGPYIGTRACRGKESDISPIWNPEFFGNAMVVNGHTWPFLNVEQRRYRFRFLNGCNSRFLILKFSNDLAFWQIGTEGGFLPAPVQLSRLLMGPAERADVIVDFTSVPVGSEIVLRNVGPDEPFGGEPLEPADPDTTGQVMQFRVVASTSSDTSTPPQFLGLPAITPIGPASTTRQVSLNEAGSETVRTSGEPPVLDCARGEEFGPREALLGVMAGSAPVAKLWDDAITENPAVGATEVWEMYNFTEDAHPIHVHELQFQVVDRQPFGGSSRPPEAWETGFKDTVIAYPGEVTRIRARFGTPGLFVWHCHIVEHEDNEMMRPYAIGPAPTPIP